MKSFFQVTQQTRLSLASFATALLRRPQILLTLLCSIFVSAWLLAACLTPPSPAQQAQDVQNAISCIDTYWGQSIAVIAEKCTNQVIAAAEDEVADAEALIEGQNPGSASLTDGGASLSSAAAKFPYESPNMRQKVNARLAARNVLK